MMNVDEAGRRNLRDFMTMYNKFTEECFTRCVKNLNYRVLTPEEKACTDRCASKLVNINHRLITVYMEINPLNKQLAALETQAQEQQQLAAAAGQEGAITQNEGAVPQNLAAQVKEVFGEDTQLTDKPKTIVTNESIASSSANLNSNNEGAVISTSSSTDSPSIAAPQIVPESQSSP